MNKMIGGALALGAVSALMLVATPSAEAALSLRLSSGATTVTVVDGLIYDQDPTVGVISYNSVLSGHTLGSFTTNISIGSSDPATPAPYPHMDLSTVQISSTGGGTIQIALSQAGFGSSTAVRSFVNNWAVSTAGSSNLQIYVDPGNALFSTAGTQVANYSATSPGGFYSGGTSSVPVSGAYSVSMFWTITHTGAGITTGNANFQVPEPMSLGLFGLGLLGLGFLWRRRDARHGMAA